MAKAYGALRLLQHKAAWNELVPGGTGTLSQTISRFNPVAGPDGPLDLSRRHERE